MFLSDYTPSELGSTNGEYVFAPCLDNLIYFVLTPVLSLSLKNVKTLEDESNIRMYMSFHDEEVGSRSTEGACSFHVIFKEYQAGQKTRWLSRKQLSIQWC